MSAPPKARTALAAWTGDSWDALPVVGERFKIRRRLGEGGMGVVYEAYDLERREPVALKTLRFRDDTSIARLKHEFRALHDLSHPNLVGLGELFESEDGPYFTMELVRGVDFLSYVRRDEAADEEPVSATAITALQGSLPQTPATPVSLQALERARAASESGERPELPGPVAFDEARLRSAAKQLALGIAALHAAGKVHRDIKPSNTLVTPEGRVVILDFGLVADATSCDISDAGAVGTVAYMAPEQARSRRVTEASDWYALGVLLFKALTGAFPHSGRTPFELLLKKQKFMAAPPRQFVADVPADLDALCMDLLRTAPAERPTRGEIFDRLGLDTGLGQAQRARSAPSSFHTTTPFVGRRAELEALRDAYERSAYGSLVHLIEGTSGVGKSQLVDEFIRERAQRDPEALVLAGRCYEREVVSYKAFDGIAHALARHLATLSVDEQEILMPLRPALLPLLFPVFRRVRAVASTTEVRTTSDPHNRRREMFAALRELFARLAQHRRLVWYIDDLQWTDGDSLALLEDLLSHDTPLPVLLIATTRPVDDAPRRAICRRIEALAPTERITLEQLPPDDARALAAVLLPSRDQATQEAVAADAGGHPFLLQELARHVEAQGQATAGATLDEMLTARISKLSNDVQRLLRVVCVFGGPVTQEVAALAAELTDGEQERATRVLRAAHLVRTNGARARDRVVAYHDRVREHVTTRLDDATRRRIHERLATALERTGAAENAPRALVRHARAAGQPVLAATHARTAARHAVTTLAFDQAAEFFATAIKLGCHDKETLRSLRIDQATALVNAGRGPEAAELFMLAAEDAEPAVRLECQRHAAEEWLATGHLERGLETLRASLDEIGEPLAATPRRAVARVLWNRLRLRIRGTSYRPRLESQIPVEVLRRLDALRAVAHGLAMIDFIRGADFNGRFMRLALRTGEARRLVFAIGTEVIFLASQKGKRTARSRRMFHKLAELADAHTDDAYMRCWQYTADGGAMFFEGQFAPAEAQLAESERLIESQSYVTTFERNNVRIFRLLALRQLGRWRTCASLFAESLRAGRQRGNLYLETTVKLLQCKTLLIRGEHAAARASLGSASWSPPEDGYHTQHYYAYEASVELALYERKAAAHMDALQRSFDELASSMLVRVKMVRVCALALHGRARLAAGLQGYEPEHTDAEVRRVARRLERERMGCATVFASLLRAGLAASKDDRDQTIQHLRAAISEASAQDMGLQLAAAQDRLGRMLGGRAGDRLMAQAARYAADEGVADADRIFDGVIPGCAT